MPQMRPSSDRHGPAGSEHGSDGDEGVPRAQHEAEVARLQRQLENAVPRAALEAAQDEVKRVGLEVERLRKGMDGMVFRAHLAAAQDEVTAALARDSDLQCKGRGRGTARYAADRSPPVCRRKLLSVSAVNPWCTVWRAAYHFSSRGVARLGGPIMTRMRGL